MYNKKLSEFDTILSIEDLKKSYVPVVFESGSDYVNAKIPFNHITTGANDLFDYKLTDHVLNNAGWANAGLYSWLSGDIYLSAYQRLIDEKLTAALETETIEQITINYYRSKNGFKIITPEEISNAETIYKLTGQSWYYILDENNKQFKLPRRHKHRLIGAKKGKTGYNLYSDGYCEQWGDIATASADAIVTTTFELKYATPPKVFKNFGHNSDSPAVYKYLGIYGTTESGFKTCYSALPSLKDYQSYHAFGYVNTSLLAQNFEYEYVFMGNTIQNAILVDVGAVMEQLNKKAPLELQIISISSTSGTVALETNTIYKMTCDGATTFILPEVNGSFHHQIKLFMAVTGTPTITWGTDTFFDESMPILEAGNYEVFFDYDPNLSTWVAGALKVGVGA